MDVADISARLRAVFEIPPRAAITDAIALITVAVREQVREPSSSSVTNSLVALEKELLDIYEHSVDHNSVPHLEAFLSVLFVLRPVLPASSLLSWFDHLRPALREPYLSPETKRNLQSLLASALDESTHAAESRSREFRRRLLQHYITDGPDSSAAEDIIEETNEATAEKLVRRTWKENLEAILETDLMTSPDESFALMNVLFADPAARYSIMALVLRIFASKNANTPPPVVSLSRSAFLQSLLTSVLLDKSTPLFQREMVTLLMIMPYMAVYVPTRLREILAPLLLTLSRALCWKERSTSPRSGRDDDSDEESAATKRARAGRRRVPSSRFVENNDPGPYDVNVVTESLTPPEVDWAIAQPQHGNAAMPIDASTFFTFIYGLFPCNTIAFLRRPVMRLQELGYSSPLKVSWTLLLDEGEIRSRSTALVRSHTFHPDVLLRDAQSELSDPQPWAPSGPSMDEVARLVASCIRLDYSYDGPHPEDIVRNALERDGAVYHTPPPTTASFAMNRAASNGESLPGRGNGNSDPESLGATPRQRLRDRLHPHLPALGPQDGRDDASNGNNSPDSLQSPRLFDSPAERLSGEQTLLFAPTHTNTPSPLSPTSPSPTRSSGPGPGSRQPSLERVNPMPAPAPSRPSPLAHPSPLSLSSIPLPEETDSETEVGMSPTRSSTPMSMTRRPTSPLAEERRRSSNGRPSSSGGNGVTSPSSTDLSPGRSRSPPPRVDSSPHLLDPRSVSASISSPSTPAIPSARTLEVLQQENARLRDLHQLAVWTREQTKRHVERLHRDRINMVGEENERQSLHNRLRDYKRRLKAVQAENKTLKGQAEITLKKTKQWVDELQDKLRDFRKEKISWTNEAVALRGQVKDAQALMAAREDLLNKTRMEYDELKIKMTYLQPKVAQMEETEKNLERLRKHVTIDESDEVKALRKDSKALQDAQETVEKMRTIIASLEHANEELQKMLKEQKSEIVRLENKVASKATVRGSNGKSPTQRFRPLSQSFSAQQFRPPSALLTRDEEYKKLEVQNAELKEDVESLTMMVEKLRSDAERVRIRQTYADTRKKSVSALMQTTPLAKSKSTPSPATVSALDLTGEGDTSTTPADRYVA